MIHRVRPAFLSLVAEFDPYLCLFIYLFVVFVFVTVVCGLLSELVLYFSSDLRFDNSRL